MKWAIVEDQQRDKMRSILGISIEFLNWLHVLNSCLMKFKDILWHFNWKEQIHMINDKQIFHFSTVLLSTSTKNEFLKPLSWNLVYLNVILLDSYLINCFFFAKR